MIDSWKILGAAVAVALAGCSMPGDPFHAKYERPAEICFAGGAVNNAHFPDHDSAFHAQHPMQYVVKKGDTLWDISRRFLSKPWHWKRIWHANPKIKNPHLIYPGDVLTVITVNGQKHVTISDPSHHHGIADTGKRTKDGRPIVRYVAEKKGKMRTMDLTAEPISIHGRGINNHASKNRIIKPEQAVGLPFVYGDGIDYLTLSMNEEVFAQGLGVPEFGTYYGIYRPGETYFDLDEQKVNKKVLPVAVEMNYIATAGVLGNDTATASTRLKLLEVAQDLREGDVLLPIADPELEIQNYYPQLPTNQCSQGYFLDNASNVTLMGKEYDTMVVSFGRADGARVGDIWKIERPSHTRVVNGHTVTAPAKEIGFVMIIQVLDDVSMALVMESKQSIYLTDHLVHP